VVAEKRRGSGPQNNKMQQTRRGWNGASLLILVLYGLSKDRPLGLTRKDR